MSDNRKPVAGYRFFECGYDEEDEGCGHKWQEKSRDIRSSSSSFCPKCRFLETPYNGVAHPEWITDMNGNILKQIKGGDQL